MICDYYLVNIQVSFHKKREKVTESVNNIQCNVNISQKQFFTFFSCVNIFQFFFLFLQILHFFYDWLYYLHFFHHFFHKAKPAVYEWLVNLMGVFFKRELSWHQYITVDMQACCLIYIESDLKKIDHIPKHLVLLEICHQRSK